MSDCPDSDGKTTLPRQLDWLNWFPAIRCGGWVHDWLRCHRVPRLLAWLAYAVSLVALCALCLLIVVLAIPPLIIALSLWDVLSVVRPSLANALRDRYV